MDYWMLTWMTGSLAAVTGLGWFFSRTESGLGIIHGLGRATGLSRLKEAGTTDQRQLIGHIAEPIVLIAAFFAMGFLISPTQLKAIELLETFMMGSWPTVYIFGFLTLLPLLIARYFRHFGDWLLTITMLYGAAFCFYLVNTFIPVLKEISDMNLGRLKPDLYLPTLLFFVFVFVKGLLPFIGALFFVKGDFRWWKFITASVVLSVLTSWLMFPFSFDLGLESLGESLGMAAFLCLIMALPISRRAMLRLVESGDAERPAFRRALSAVGCFLIAPYLMLVPVSAGHDFLVNQVGANFSEGPPVAPRSPAEVNMMDVLGPQYMQRHENQWTYQGPGFRARKDLKKSGINLLLIQGGEYATPLAPERDAIGFNEAHRRIFQKIRESNQPIFETFPSIDRATYYSSASRTEGYHVPSFPNMREVTRVTSYETMLLLHDGETSKALEQLDRLFHFGGLMREGTLVEIMMGAAIRGIASGTAYNMVWRLKDDPEGLRQLQQTLKNAERSNRQSFPYMEVKHGEPGFWDIVVLTELITPSFTRASIIYYRNWYRFDLVQLATALELHRHDHGVYPESLEALAPAYLDHIPVDPFEGKPYEYTVAEGGFTLVAEIDINTDDTLYDGFPFPYGEQKR